MNTVTATPMRGQPPFLARAAEPVMPYEPEPVFSSGGAPDELSASYVRAYAAAYRRANAEADAAEEAESLRNELAARDWTPEQFAAVLGADAPGVLFSFEAIQHVASDAMGVKVTCKFGGWAKFTGVPVRHLEAESWRELARLLVEEHKARKGMGRAVPVVEVAV